MDYSKLALVDLLAQHSAIGLEISRRVTLLERTVDSMASEMDQRDSDTTTLIHEGRY